MQAGGSEGRGREVGSRVTRRVNSGDESDAPERLVENRAVTRQEDTVLLCSLTFV